MIFKFFSGALEIGIPPEVIERYRQTGDLDLQGDYDNAPFDFDRVYYRAAQILLITNYATLVLTCTVHVICI